MNHKKQTLLEAYNKVIMNEIHSNVPMGDDDESEGVDDKEYMTKFIEDIQIALKLGDIGSAKSLIEVLNAKVNGEGGSHSDLDLDEEPQSESPNQGTGQYLSKKDRSAQHKSDFLINRMNLKPGKDF